MRVPTLVRFGITTTSALLVSALAVGLPAPSASGQERHRPPSALDLAIDDLVSRVDGPVAVIAVVDNGRRERVHRAGVADVDSGRPPGTRQHLRIASMTKAFAGAVALRLVSKQVLDLDDTIGKWAPDLPIAWHDVTLRQLLQHTSGVPDFTGNPAFSTAVGASPTIAPSPRDLLAFAGTSLAFTPGTMYVYSNSDNIVVGLIIEAATGQSFDQTLRSEVLDPVGLDRTSLPGPADPMLPVPFIHGYLREDDGTRVDVSETVSFGGWSWASGGIVSTPTDLGRFVRAYVGGDLFGGETRREQFRFIPGGNSEPRGPGDNAAGLALFRYQTRCGTVYGHTGNILGYTHLMAATADGRASVTFAINIQASEELVPALRRAQELAVCEALGR